MDTTRQILQLIAEDIYLNMTDAYDEKNIADVQYYGSNLLQLMTDLDQVLNSDDHFLLGMWVSNAKKMASSKSERVQFEYNSKNQLTLWGPDGEILDYARKQWAGLMNDYYKQRWALFIDTIVQDLSNGTQFSQDQFNYDVFQKVETPFCDAHTSYLACSMGDSIDISKNMFDKYWPYCEQAAKTTRKLRVNVKNPRYEKWHQKLGR